MERYDILELIRIALRRFFWVYIPFTVIAAIGLVALSFVPARYHSKALLIVENQQISTDLVPSAIRAYAEDRLRTIKAEVEARDNIIRLSEKFNLIDQTSDVPFSRRVSQVRSDISINIKTINGRRRRMDEPTTITFEVGFVHENPRTAFRVANQLVTDFLEENVEARIQVAEGTAGFFRDEERDLRRALNEVQQQIADVREANPEATPEAADLQRALVQRLETDITRFEDRISSTEQELSLLQMQQPLIVDANEQTDTEQLELREKRRILSNRKLQYTDDHPDVIALSEEVLVLEMRLDPPRFRTRVNSLIRDLDARLADSSLGPDEKADLGARRQRLVNQMSEAEGIGKSQNMALLRFQSNIDAFEQRIAGYRERIEEKQLQLEQAEAQLSLAPGVAARLATLEVEEGRIQQQLTRTQQKRTDAERFETLESQQKAERITMLEAPVLPDVPTSPNIPQLAIMVVGAAGGAAAVLGLGPVFLFPRLESKRQLASSLGSVPVIEIPEIVDQEEQKFRRIVFVTAVVVSVILTLALGGLAVKVLL